jgi:hypothetical protein
MHDPAQDAAIVFASRTRLIGRQQRLDLRPLLVVKPKQIRPQFRPHRLASRFA